MHTEGISNITLRDVQYAGDWGGVIKLIGRARRLPDGRLSVMVSPAFISHESQLATVDDVFNGILVRADATGYVVFYGKGAGKLPTASAVVGDVIDCVKAEHTIQSLSWSDSAADTVCDYRQTPACFYLCCRGAKAVQAVRNVFGSVRFLHREGAPAEEAAFITPEGTEAQLAAQIKQLESGGTEILSAIRVLDY